MVKKIGAFFTSEMEKLINFGDSLDLNKKKYFLNELCIFHYMLNEKYKYKYKLWNQPTYFYEADL